MCRASGLFQLIEHWHVCTFQFCHWRNSCYRATCCESLYPPLQSHLCNPLPPAHKDFVADRKATVPLVDLQHSCTSHLASFTLNNQLSMYCSPDYVITKLARTCVPLIIIQCLNINSLLSASTFHAFEFLEMMRYSIQYLL